MLKIVVIGSLMMAITTAIHASFMTAMMRLLENRTRNQKDRAPLTRLYVVVESILMIFVATLLEASAWAVAYLTLGAISGMEPALYFSVVTFTTVGYGDVVLTPEWRLLGSFEAVNGIIMFGWSTALVMAVVQRVYTSTMSR